MKKIKALIVIALLSLISITVYAFVLESDTYETEKQCPVCGAYFSPPVYQNGVWVYTCTVCGHLHEVYIEEPKDTTVLSIQDR